ncbi:hypothetical protein [Streptomyces sp. cg35]
MELVYDPRTLGNAETPERITDGRFNLAVIVVASAVLVASLATLAFG